MSISSSSTARGISSSTSRWFRMPPEMAGVASLRRPAGWAWQMIVNTVHSASTARRGLPPALQMTPMASWHIWQWEVAAVTLLPDVHGPHVESHVYRGLLLGPVVAHDIAGDLEHHPAGHYATALSATPRLALDLGLTAHSTSSRPLRRR